MVALRKDGNPFNTTPILPPQAASPARAPSPEEPLWRQTNGPTSARTPTSGGERKLLTSKMIIWIAVAGTLIVIALLLCLLLRKCCRTKRKDENSNKHYVDAHKDSSVRHKHGESALQQSIQMETGNFTAIHSFCSNTVKCVFFVHIALLENSFLNFLNSSKGAKCETT